ncbi:hypothetical protein DSM112329_01165 [Paraconexibacter sp. AEG42_29]|uniref:Bacterial Ig-like domain-containing protein n=2 Tax=Paraconexibacter sp. AEG42_29 TaxID=2997339 RepID=A0AAU7ARQ0_9ACTN
MRRQALTVAGAALALAAAWPATGQAAPPPFEPIAHERIATPAGVMPWAPTWSPDGRHILFHDYNGGREWMATADGRNLRCVTCGFDDRPGIIGAFSYVFPDNRRMFLANELGDVASVLECRPSLVDCAEHAYLPVDLSADDSTLSGNPGLGRRTYHLAPDGEHLGYTNTRPDQLVMLVAGLRRAADRYVVTDPRVVNPTPATSLLDRSAERWANGSQLFELKSFADGGAAAIIVGEREGGNADMFKLDLATGRTTRLTADADWDEDGAQSPDGRALIAASWRGMDRLTPFGIFPTRPFLTYPLGAAVAIHYVSSKAGFACDLQPWLLAGSGDAGGTLAGQPLAPYRGGDDIVGNNLAGVAFWSPDSTRVLVQERQLRPVPAGSNSYVRQKGTAPNRLLVARLDRRPSAPAATVKTVVGAWAPAPQAYRGAFGLPGITTVDGPRGGTATIVRGGNVAAIVGRVTYSRYSDDGVTFLDGTEDVTGSAARLGIRYAADVTATDAGGRPAGHHRVAVAFSQRIPAPPVTEPPTTLSGTVDTAFGGRRVTRLAAAAACPESFVRPSRLEVGARRTGTLRVRVTVRATILGDSRPVRGARVLLAGRRTRTNAAGVATVRLPRAVKRGVRAVVATAGDTFDRGRATVRLPR